MDIYEAPDYYSEKAVLKGELDIAFTISRIDKTKFHSKVVKTQYPCILINEKNPLLKKNKINFEDLKDEKFVLTNQNFKMHHNFINRSRQADFLLRMTELVNFIVKWYVMRIYNIKISIIERGY